MALYIYSVCGMKVLQSEIQIQKETLRIETFSDGVFCIAVTLLSIEIGVEAKANITDEGLRHSLLEQWPLYLAYVISFINVLLAWIGHHSLFKLLRKTDNLIMVTNGLLMMLVALVPFPTKTLGAFLLTGALKTAVVFYTGYFVLISLAFRFLWFAAARNKDLLIYGITVSQSKAIDTSSLNDLLKDQALVIVYLKSPQADQLNSLLSDLV